jgi:hypothetical protein
MVFLWGFKIKINKHNTNKYTNHLCFVGIDEKNSQKEFEG